MILIQQFVLVSIDRLNTIPVGDVAEFFWVASLNGRNCYKFELTSAGIVRFWAVPVAESMARRRGFIGVSIHN